MRLFGEIMQANPEAELCDPPCVYYIAWRPEDCEILCAAPVSGNPQPADGSRLEHFPAVQALRWTHTGPYDGLSQVWNSFWSFVQHHYFDAVGTPWDRYITDPQTEPDSSLWITELYIPVQIPKL